MMEKAITTTPTSKLIITELKEKNEKKGLFSFLAILIFAKFLTLILTLKFKTPVFALAFFGVLYSMAPNFWKKEMKSIFDKFSS